MGRQMKDAAGTVRKTPDCEVVMGSEMAFCTTAVELMYKRPNGDRYCLEHALDAARKCDLCCPVMCDGAEVWCAKHPGGWHLLHKAE